MNTVPWNDWHTLPAPTATPLPVTVILPAYQGQAALELTVAALIHQDYPVELLEILIVDDGSEPPIVVPGSAGDRPVRVVRQSRDSFGLARARNTGAEAAGGEVLVFLDCDMIPEPGFVAAHVGWHTVCDHAVVIGSRAHVEVDGIDAPAVAAAATAGSIEALFDGREIRHPEWIEAHLERTDRFRSKASDLWRAMSGGNLSVRKSLWDLVGGADETFRQWGGEDNETAYRLLSAGAVVIPESAAMAWHQGEGHEPSEEERRSAVEQQARLEHLIADPTMRRDCPGRVYEVPQTIVRLRSEDWSDADVDAAVASLLRGLVTDLRIEIERGAPSVWLSRRMGNDPRVRLVEVGKDTSGTPAFIRLSVDEPVQFGETFLEDLVAAFETGGVGTVRVARESGMVARLQRVEGRLARVGRPEDGESLFGVAEVELEVYPPGVPVPRFRQVAERRIESLESELEAARREVGRLGGEVRSLQSRRVVRIADRIGSWLRR